MSGGSWDYVTHNIEYAAERLESEKCYLRRALGEHMVLVAKAMHDIEWVDSGDMSDGNELESIKAVLRDSKAIKEVYEDKGVDLSLVEGRIKTLEEALKSVIELLRGNVTIPVNNNYSHEMFSFKKNEKLKSALDSLTIIKKNVGDRL